MMRRLYQAAAEGCAEMVVRVPALEPAFRRLGGRLWSHPRGGRFYRSAAHRVALRLRSAGTPFRTCVVAGVPVVLDATEFTTLALYFGGDVYESVTTHYLVQALRPGSVFVDIGANHGYFSILAAALVGAGGRVASFEPNPAVFAQLETHVTLNRFESRITLVPLALSDVPDAAARFFVSQAADNSGFSSLTPGEETLQSGNLSDAHTIPVRVDTFDRWFTSSGLTSIDLLKVDVEGAEAKVIAGMKQTLAAGVIRELILETTWGSRAHQVLCENGYEPRALDPVGSLSNVLYVKRGPSS
jgi:FkbM family methyltransferase